MILSLLRLEKSRFFHDRNWKKWGSLEASILSIRFVYCPAVVICAMVSIFIGSTWVLHNSQCSKVMSTGSTCARDGASTAEKASLLPYTRSPADLDAIEFIKDTSLPGYVPTAAGRVAKNVRKSHRPICEDVQNTHVGHLSEMRIFSIFFDIVKQLVFVRSIQIKSFSFRMLSSLMFICNWNL